MKDMSTSTRPARPACPAYNDRVAVDLGNGTTLYGQNRGCVFGDCSSAHEHFVAVDTAIWADGTVVRAGWSGRAGKFWGVRPLTDAERSREQREHDYALSLVD
jgi:hypothetical protein